MKLDELAEKIIAINNFNGWDEWEPFKEKQSIFGDPFKLGTKLALIHSEVTEMLEIVRKTNNAEEFIEEGIDVIIRTLDVIGRIGKQTGTSLDDVMIRKLEKNKKRGYKHGGRVI